MSSCEFNVQILILFVHARRGICSGITSSTLFEGCSLRSPTRPLSQQNDGCVCVCAPTPVSKGNSRTLHFLHFDLRSFNRRGALGAHWNGTNEDTSVASEKSIRDAGSTYLHSRHIFGWFFVTSCLQGHQEERFGGVFVFWGGRCIDSCSAAGPLGTAFWRCLFGWLLAAVRQPTWRLNGCTYPPFGAKIRPRRLSGRALGLLSSASSKKHPNAYSSVRGGFFFPRVELPGHWRERFGGTCLDDFSLRRACRATYMGHWGERFGGVFVFWGGCCVDSCSAAGPLGTAFWRCLFDSFWMAFGNAEVVSPLWASNAAVRQPTWRLDGCTCPHLEPKSAHTLSGRAIGALAVELCILAKTSYAFCSARGAFFG